MAQAGDVRDLHLLLELHVSFLKHGNTLTECNEQLLSEVVAIGRVAYSGFMK